MRPDNETERYFLNFSGVADTVAEIIVQARGRPISIGVSGAWGIGKSSMIKLTQASVAKRPRKEGEREFIFVEFNAWLYQGYDDARAALMDVIATKLEAEAKVPGNCPLNAGGRPAAARDGDGYDGKPDFDPIEAAKNPSSYRAIPVVTWYCWPSFSLPPIQARRARRDRVRATLRQARRSSGWLDRRGCGAAAAGLLHDPGSGPCARNASTTFFVRRETGF